MDAPLKGYLNAEQRQRQEQEQKAPKAAALRTRCYELLQALPDVDSRSKIQGLIFTLDVIIRSGKDIDNTDYWGPYEAEAKEMIARAEATLG